MRKRPSPHPTEAEFEVLTVLWREGPRTVRQIHEALQVDGRDTSMTTTLKTMQIMIDKGYLTRSDTRPHVYSAALAEDATQAGLLEDLAHKAFNGSVSKMLIRAVRDVSLSESELAEIRRLIENTPSDEGGAE